jgi:WD40-like Beta Propeller Repeat
LSAGVRRADGSCKGSHWGQNGKIAFQSFSSGICLNVEIYTMNPDGTGRAQLTHNAARYEFSAQSPDGTKMAFSGGGIWVMDADGSNITQLTNANDYGPTWSPDGTKIAFTGISDIWTMNADGSNQTNLTNTSSDFESEPDWGVHSQDESQVPPDEPQAPTNSGAQYEDHSSQRPPEPAPPKSGSEKVLPNTVSNSPLPNTGGLSLLLVASALLFCGGVVIFRWSNAGFKYQLTR